MTGCGATRLSSSGSLMSRPSLLQPYLVHPLDVGNLGWYSPAQPRNAGRACLRSSSTGPGPETTPATRCDVLVIGGGPGGSTIAALLAERGKNVVLVEKDRHPRFHIGESLLPLNLPLFEKLGVKEEIERIAMPKYGIEFVSPVHDKVVHYEFANAWDKSFPYSYQVRRSSFDHV